MSYRNALNSLGLVSTYCMYKAVLESFIAI